MTRWTSPKPMAYTLIAEPGDPKDAGTVRAFFTDITLSPLAMRLNYVAIDAASEIRVEASDNAVAKETDGAIADNVAEIAAKFPAFRIRLLRKNPDNPADSAYREYTNGRLAVKRGARVVPATLEYDDDTLRRIAGLLRYHGHREAAALVSSRIGKPAGWEPTGETEN